MRELEIVIQNDNKFRVQESSQFDLILLIGCTLHIKTLEVLTLILEQNFENCCLLKKNKELVGIVFDDLEEARKSKAWIESLFVVGKLLKK